MKYLFIHPSFAGQQHHIIRHLARDTANEVVFLCKKSHYLSIGAMSHAIPNVKLMHYTCDERENNTTYLYSRRFEQDIKRGKAIFEACVQLKNQGFVPDVISYHPSWGAGLFLHDIFPDTPILCYAEYYTRNAKNLFDTRLNISEDTFLTNEIKNATTLLGLTHADIGVTPTKWQKSLFPKELQGKIRRIHDGIDTEAISSNPTAKALTLPDGTTLTQDDKIITYVARAFEASRGWPTFIDTAEQILARHPDCHICVIGGKGNPYGDAIETDIVVENLESDRFHLLGELPYKEYIHVLQFSTVHIYLTIPIMLSWSCLEAMAAGCIVIGSDTPPVAEVIENGKNGFLVDFFSHDEVAEKVLYALENPDEMEKIRHNARQTIIDHYSVEVTLPQYLALLEEITGTKLAIAG